MHATQKLHLVNEIFFCCDKGLQLVDDPTHNSILASSNFRETWKMICPNLVNCIFEPTGKMKGTVCIWRCVEKVSFQRNPHLIFLRVLKETK